MKGKTRFDHKRASVLTTAVLSIALFGEDLSFLVDNSKCL